MRIDGNRKGIIAANQFVTQDATGTPQTSPLSLTTTAIFTIVLPPNAVRITFLSGADLRVSDLAAMTRYDLVKANVKEEFQVANMDKVYVQNDATGTNNLYFRILSI